MTYYIVKCNDGIDIVNDYGRGFCFSNNDCTSEMNITGAKIEFSLDYLAFLKDSRIFANNENNRNRKAFLKQVVEWYIKERLCISLV